MHRFYLPPGECRSDALTLSVRDTHHALHVLRLRQDEQVTVLDGAGTELLCEVQTHNRNQVQLAVLKRSSAPSPVFRITLVQAIPKGKIIENIVQKAAELGVSRIVPLISERVITRMEPDDAAQKAKKWQWIAVEAIKQCGCAWLPKVEAPITPENFLGRKEAFDLSLIASLQPGACHPRTCFQEFKNRHGRSPATVCVWIGPEGDFTPAEVAAVESSGAYPMSLGPQILRSETAAVYCLSILNYELSAESPGDVQRDWTST